mgnify:CR=1 FL=1
MKKFKESELGHLKTFSNLKRRDGLCWKAISSSRTIFKQDKLMTKFLRTTDRKQFGRLLFVGDDSNNHEHCCGDPKRHIYQK